jgi:hypothetical protein
LRKKNKRDNSATGRPALFGRDGKNKTGARRTKEDKITARSTRTER